MSWDPVCKCGHACREHVNVDVGGGCVEEGCRCELHIVDVARRAALLDAAEWFDGLDGQAVPPDGAFDDPAPWASNELRRMAEEKP